MFTTICDAMLTPVAQAGADCDADPAAAARLALQARVHQHPPSLLQPPAAAQRGAARHRQLPGPHHGPRLQQTGPDYPEPSPKTLAPPLCQRRAFKHSRLACCAIHPGTTMLRRRTRRSCRVTVCCMVSQARPARAMLTRISCAPHAHEKSSMNSLLVEAQTSV